MKKISYVNEDQLESQVAEPSIIYGHGAKPEKSLSSCPIETEVVDKSGRMTVDEYFDKVWTLVVKKHENI